MATTKPERLVGRSRRSTLQQLLALPLASYYLVLGPVVLLVAVGLLMSLSSSSVYAQAMGKTPYYFAIRHAIFLVPGTVGGWWLAHRSRKMLRVVAWVGLVGSIFLLCGVLMPGIGVETKGNRAWIGIGPVTMQPSEFAKLFFAMWAGAVFSTKQKLLDQPKHLLFPLLAGFAVPAGLILAGGDLGTAMVFTAILFGALFVVGAPKRVMFGLGAVGVALIGAMVLVSENRMARILSFLDPTAADDPNASQQPMSALYALASGGWFGLGLGGSRQKWGGLADAAQNDYVFAVIGEELGLFGALSVLALFGVLFYAGLRIATRADSLFIRVTAGAITTWFMVQALVNIGVAMGLLPVIGVPLPFISVGGSALMSNLMAAGVLLACAKQEPAARRLAEADREERKPRVTRVVDKH